MEKIKSIHGPKEKLNSEEAYKKIKSVIMKDLDYNEDEIEYDSERDMLIIKSIIIIAWDELSQLYCISVSVTIEPFGFACLLSYLFKNGFANIRMIDRFYVRNEKSEEELYNGVQAIKEYQKDFRNMVKQEIAEEMFQMRLLYDFPCKTVH